MPWITFSADHVKARLSSRELDVYEETATANNDDSDGNPTAPSTPRLPEIVDQVCNRFRGAIRANPLVTVMGDAGTLPDFCIYDAAVLARAALIGLNPVPEGMTDPRRDEVRAAEKALEALRTMNPKAFADDPAPAGSEASASYGGAPLLDF